MSGPSLLVTFIPPPVSFSLPMFLREGGGGWGLLLLFLPDLAPPPGLLWYDSHAAGPPLFSLNGDFYFSQAKGGVPNTIPYGTLRVAMIFKLFIGGGVSATLTSSDQQPF